MTLLLQTIILVVRALPDIEETGMIAKISTLAQPIRRHVQTTIFVSIVSPLRKLLTANLAWMLDLAALIPAFREEPVSQLEVLSNVPVRLATKEMVSIARISMLAPHLLLLVSLAPSVMTCHLPR